MADATTLISPDRASTDLRRAALGALLALVGYTLLPTFRAVVEAIIGSNTSVYPSPSEVPQNEWWGISGGVIFFLIGIGVLLLVLNLPTSPLGRALGVIGGAGFLLSGAGARAMYSLASANLTHTGADSGAQTAALWAVNIANGGPLILAGCSFAGWLILYGLSRTGLSTIGTGVGITVAIAGMLIALAGMSAAFFPAQFLYVPILVLLTIVLYRRAGRMGQTATDGS